MRHIALIFSFCTAALLSTPGCGDDETTTTGDPPEVCVDYSSVETNACCDTPPSSDGSCTGNPVPCSFKDHIVPLFQQTCNFSSCHQTGNGPQEGLGLGLANGAMMTQDDIDGVHEAILGGAALRSTLPLVAAGDPAGSWLLAKVEYQNLASCEAVASTCTAEGCGVLMPFNSPKMKDWQIAMVRAWIASGANND